MCSRVMAVTDEDGAGGNLRLQAELFDECRARDGKRLGPCGKSSLTLRIRDECGEVYRFAEPFLYVLGQSPHNADCRIQLEPWPQKLPDIRVKPISNVLRVHTLVGPRVV